MTVNQKSSTALQITIDTQDAQNNPSAPYTLTVRPADSSGVPSREPCEFDDGSNCLVGSNVPDMLRQLAGELAKGTLTHWGDPVGFSDAERPTI